ncbi:MULTISPECIES: hypothetical protein [unclassified Pseudomonas]|uniref:hypothetical protein n=1 Tax=unclassified Pseudomonas TaxID=196821 RepID=UPI0011A61280|nr:MULTISPECIES: hypothetical protein [unclassified Pseudomonas]TWC13804.1 hypothetical protein FBY05_12553 [Pseudomonas sp. SJZ083]TWC43300.1 hypothetical protein FBY01_12538 [Pseudomonas sp. SJZ077]
MTRVVTKDDCLAEINRFFKYYSVYCQSPDPDTVREVLASIYSINDKVRKAGYPDFFDSDEFLAIKAIRNYAIHQAEIHNKARALPMQSTAPIKADLSILCLIPKDVIEAVCENTNLAGKTAIKNACVYYRSYVDIYPCIFNFGVQLFLYTERNSLEVSTNEYRAFKNSIEFERKNNYPHHVKGGFSLPHGGDVNEFIESSLHSIEEKNELQNALYSEKDGMFTFKGFS